MLDIAASGSCGSDTLAPSGPACKGLVLLLALSSERFAGEGCATPYLQQGEVRSGQYVWHVLRALLFVCIPARRQHSRA